MCFLALSRVCSVYASCFEDRWLSTCALHVCRRTWMVAARLPWYRSSWPPRVMPYPLALHNNLARRVCSGISPWALRFFYPSAPLPFRKGPVIGRALVLLSFLFLFFFFFFALFLPSPPARLPRYMCYSFLFRLYPFFLDGDFYRGKLGG